MGTFLIVRGLQSLLVVWAVVTIVFFVSHVLADPITVLASPESSPQDISKLKEREGLDEPVVVQYLRFLGDTARLDMGSSFRTGQPALGEVQARIPSTLKLGLAALAVSIIVGIPLGVLSAVKRGTPLDLAGRLLALVGQAMPNFWLGLILIMFFSVRLGWLPTGGSGGWKHLILPAVTLGSFSIAAIMRLTRASMLQVLGMDFTRTARAKGLGERAVIYRHALRNALIPVITIIGIQAGQVIAGSVIVETVFAWPGVGRLMVQSISTSDYPVVQVGVIFISAFIVLTNVLVDMSYRLVDPRIQEGVL